MNFPKKNYEKLKIRLDNQSLRSLEVIPDNLIDFCSNDYLGLSRLENVYTRACQFLETYNSDQINGATGSRLISGNYDLYNTLECHLAEVHYAESALVFNSGYNANLGFFQSMPLKGDIILYDSLIHASIRDGIKLSQAKSYKFRHNDLNHLQRLLQKFGKIATQIYVVTESVFSMDGDTPDLLALSNLCRQNKALLVVDEAHSLGVFGYGLVQKLGLENDVFARIMTFGKALGCHGASVLGSQELKQYLVNFARSFIYTTALPPHSLATIQIAYNYLSEKNTAQQKLQANIEYFKEMIDKLELSFIESNSAIQCCVIGGNQETKSHASKLQYKGFAVKAICSPTVPSGEERLRFCLHSYNTFEEISEVLSLLASVVDG